MSINVGERKILAITLPKLPSVLNCYLIGPDGAGSQHLEFDYPCDEIVRVDDTHYTFTTPKHLATGNYSIEILATIDGVERVTHVPAYSVGPNDSPELNADVGAVAP